LLYCLIHSITASVSVKSKIAGVTGRHFKYYRLFYSVFAAVSLGCLIIYQFSHESRLVYKPSWPVFVISIPLIAIGLIIMISCITKYFVNLSGVDVFMKRKPQQLLETNGLHAYVRHPLYSGTLLFIWALCIVFPLWSNVIACIVITIYTWIGIRMEEHKLMLEYGDDYKSYAADIPMLIPSFRRKPAIK
jgi:protein-S-isoprenylcysteine O-methyltransferase Ste14